MLKKTLANNNYYQQFKNLFSYRDNVFVYCDISKIKGLLPNVSNFELLNPTKTQEEALSEFYGMGIQLTSARDLLYLNACP